MTQPTTRNRETGETIPGKFELVELPVPELKAGEVLVEIAGCGVSRADLGFFYDGVPSVSKPPLTLGHEISGKVVAGEASWIGKEVLMPAMMPCGQCPLCQAGLGNRCFNQKIPGNCTGIYGGFSSHIPVIGESLFEVKYRNAIPLEHLAVASNAATTAFQAVKRALIGGGDNVIVIGAGEMGRYIVQMVKALGAGTVITVDIVEIRLQKLLQYGADIAINAAGKELTEVAADVKRVREQKGLRAIGWKIFEATGATSGLDTALTLLDDKGKLIIICFGEAKVEYATSRLMTPNTEIIGTWGCLPEYYHEGLEMVTSGKIALSPFVITRPMSWIGKIFEEAYNSPSDKRIVLTTDDLGLDDSPEPKSCR